MNRVTSPERDGNIVDFDQPGDHRDFTEFNEAEQKIGLPTYETRTQFLKNPWCKGEE
ncbi:hypothetical protein KIN20_009010 [Parelaphostrongylus tenuis]|uniref:Uncharacterized protein n=1 Tax=Parelaphostrongylus tenuis TaxID=148309 RepID=A0AAD5QKZ9_PARTN|nr:hypothetical protein KIN20_009010 [Parelaphostrongylus tenuis]